MTKLSFAFVLVMGLAAPSFGTEAENHAKCVSQFKDMIAHKSVVQRGSRGFWDALRLGWVADLTVGRNYAVPTTLVTMDGDKVVSTEDGHLDKSQLHYRGPIALLTLNILFRVALGFATNHIFGTEVHHHVLAPPGPVGYAELALPFWVAAHNTYVGSFPSPIHWLTGRLRFRGDADQRAVHSRTHGPILRDLLATRNPFDLIEFEGEVYTPSKVQVTVNLEGEIQGVKLVAERLSGEATTMGSKEFDIVDIVRW